jgi:tripartite-type tricarboxylate transporter receptor subunit TctC
MRARITRICCLAFVVLSAAIGAASAADYPSRPIRLVVPYVAGGPTDAQARIFAQYLARDLKQSVFVENKGGAQGAIGAEAVAHGEPDGYSLLFTTSSVIELNPVLYKKLSYDPARELRMLGILTDVPMIMIVHPSIPAKTLAEFIAYAKQNPGKLNFGSAGSGSIGQLAGEMFKQQTGVEMTHVPYKGAGAALTDLLSGQIQVMFESIGISLPPAQAGLVRPLGVSSVERIAELPELPTIAESGYPGYRVSVWYGIAAPARMPAEAAQIIAASINRALGDEAFRASLTRVGFAPLQARDEASIKAFVDADKARWLDVVKKLNFSLD